MAATPPICDFGWRPPAFRLTATDGKTYGLDDIRGQSGTLIVFICNHCPYVKSIIDRLVAEARELQAAGIGIAAICANDARNYPEDSFANMKQFAAAHGFSFPYLHDETQAVARAWDAVCTPDFYGFNADLELQYRGRLDASKTTLVPDARPELHEAMMQIVRTGKGPQEQIASMGCSIKWKAA